MIEQVTSFRATDKSTHETAYAAWQRELLLWLRANGCDNAAIAEAIVRKVEGRPESLRALRTIAAGLTDSAPRPPRARRKPKAAPVLELTTEHAAAQPPQLQLTVVA